MKIKKYLSAALCFFLIGTIVLPLPGNATLYKAKKNAAFFGFGMVETNVIRKAEKVCSFIHSEQKNSKMNLFPLKLDDVPFWPTKMPDVFKQLQATTIEIKKDPITSKIILKTNIEDILLNKSGVFFDEGELYIGGLSSYGKFVKKTTNTYQFEEDIETYSDSGETRTLDDPQIVEYLDWNGVSLSKDKKWSLSFYVTILRGNGDKFGVKSFSIEWDKRNDDLYFYWRMSTDDKENIVLGYDFEGRYEEGIYNVTTRKIKEYSSSWGGEEKYDGKEMDLSIKNAKKGNDYGVQLTWKDANKDTTESYTIFRRWAKSSNKNYVAIKTVKNTSTYFDKLKENQNGYTYYYYVVANSDTGFANKVISNTKKVVFKYGK